MPEHEILVFIVDVRGKSSQCNVFRAFASCTHTAGMQMEAQAKCKGLFPH